MMKIKYFLSIVLLILSTHSIFAQDIVQEDDALFATREISKKIEISPNSIINIRSALTLSGTIQIETSDENIAVLRYVKRAKNQSKSKAIDFIDIISVEYEVTHNGLRIDLRAPNPAPWSGTNESGTVELHLMLPEFCSLEFDTQYFDIEAEGPFNSFILPSSFGRIYVENVLQKTEISTANRKITVRDLAGDVNITTSNATLEASDIHSPHNRIELRNDGGDVDVSDIVGELNIKNNYGRIDVRNFHPMGEYNYIRTSNAPIIIEMEQFSTDKLFVTNSYEDIEILIPDNVSSQVSLAVEEGSKIEVSEILSKPDFIQKNRLDLILGTGKSTINSSIRGNGNIYFRGFSTGE